MRLSIIIPVYNEEKTIKNVLKKISAVKLKGIDKEVVVVDDASTDNTTSIISAYQKRDRTIVSIRHKRNQGKGAAIKTACKSISGDYILIQDADLEYDPSYIPILLDPLIKKQAEVIFGTRLKRLPNFKRDERTPRLFIHYLANHFLSFLTSLLYGQRITDMETGYKLFPKKALRKFTLSSKSFDFEPELTVKLIKSGYKIHEVPITTYPREYSEGKKIQAFKEGIKALRILIKYKFSK